MHAERRILTGADQLLTLVQEKNVISLGKAARILESDPEMIALLAESLEDHGSVVLHRTFGDVLLVDKEHYEATRGSVGLIKPVLINLLSFNVRNRSRAASQERARELDERSRTIEKRARLLDERSKSLEKFSESLQATERHIKEREEHLRVKTSELETREQHIATEQKLTEKRALQLERREKRIASLLDKARRML